MPLQFENNFSPAFLVENIQPVIIHELPDISGVISTLGPFPPNPSNRIIQTDQKLHVHLRYRVNGLLAQLLPTTCVWKATVYFEQYGSAEAIPGEYSFSTSHVPVLIHDYHITVSVPENALQPGFYKMAVVINFQGPGGIPLPPTGFAELGNLNVYAAA